MGIWCTKGSTWIRFAAISRRLLLSSQSRVSGEVRVLFRPGSAFVEGVTSPYSLMAASKGGSMDESAGEWTPTDALGYSRCWPLTGVFYKRAGANAPVPAQAHK